MTHFFTPAEARLQALQVPYATEIGHTKAGVATATVAKTAAVAPALPNLPVQVSLALKGTETKFLQARIALKGTVSPLCLSSNKLRIGILRIAV